MKRFVTMLAAVLFMGAMAMGQAQAASQYTLNLDALNPGWGKYENILVTTVEGFAKTNQSFGSDGIFNEGDTFTQHAVFQKLTYKSSDTGSSKTFRALDLAGKMLFIYADQITGYATDFKAANIFTYVFNAGANISMYVGDFIADLANIDAGYLATATKIADLTLTVGKGAGLDGFISGQKDSGSSRLTATLNSAPAGVWSTSAIADLAAANVQTHFVLDTTNWIPGGVQDTAEGFTATVSSSGPLTVEATTTPVPEPSTALLLGAGLLGLGALGRRRN